MKVDTKDLVPKNDKNNYFYFFENVKDSINKLQNKDVLEIISSILKYLPCVEEGKSGYFNICLRCKSDASFDNKHCSLYYATSDCFYELLGQVSQLEKVLEGNNVSKIKLLDEFRYYGDSLHFYLQALYSNIVDYEKAKELLKKSTKKFEETLKSEKSLL